MSLKPQEIGPIPEETVRVVSPRRLSKGERVYAHAR